jgi:hypothetical protein
VRKDALIEARHIMTKVINEVNDFVTPITLTKRTKVCPKRLSYSFKPVFRGQKSGKTGGDSTVEKI